MNSSAPNFKSTAYFIGQRVIKCYACAASTRVVAVGLPVNHQALEGDEDGVSEVWQTVAANAMLFHLEWLPEPAVAQLRKLAPGFALDRSESPGERYWTNHCQHCGSPLDDQDLHCEAGDSFVPLSEQEGLRIQLTEILEPFEAWAAGYALDVLFVAFPRPT